MMEKLKSYIDNLEVLNGLELSECEDYINKLEQQIKEFKPKLEARIKQNNEKHRADDNLH